MTVPSVEFADTKACYLEFEAPDWQTHFIESTFYLRDNGTLSAQSKGNFASPYASLRFEYSTDRTEGPPKLKYVPPKPTISPKTRQIFGVIWGVKFKQLPPLAVQQPPMAALDKINAIHSHCEQHSGELEGFHQALIETCTILMSLTPSDENSHQLVTAQSARTHRRQFKSRMGISPKPFAALNRFQSALSDISQSNSSLSDIAYEHAFADQAHMSRDFREKTGHSPAQFREVWSEDNSVRFLQDHQESPALRLGIVID
ncbi:helix-turn-helix transcriptional regulator [Pseudovibrio sp. JE062]|uniref:helix-turn-helix transcriptional regulator n=1 Tax=Pseudovibrio sp. JE062 TaxID=439495 RepID=UPI000186B879|nr:helix-turn-helix transcriptional regulator [Pseudovibrio sp. JE062]EEA92953.1 transcriptional regulator, AraC family [Pseudovibrio sp. JE062]